MQGVYVQQQYLQVIVLARVLHHLYLNQPIFIETLKSNHFH